MLEDDDVELLQQILDHFVVSLGGALAESWDAGGVWGLLEVGKQAVGALDEGLDGGGVVFLRFDNSLLDVKLFRHVEYLLQFLELLALLSGGLDARHHFHDNRQANRVEHIVIPVNQVRPDLNALRDLDCLLSCG